MQTLQAELEELKSDIEQVAYDLGEAGGFGLADGLTPVEKLQSASSGIREEFQAAQEALEEAAAEIFRIIDVQDDTEDEDPQERLQRALRLLRNDYAAAED
jgi:multidrug resistance efflux pump